MWVCLEKKNIKENGIVWVHSPSPHRIFFHFNRHLFQFSINSRTSNTFIFCHYFFMLYCLLFKKYRLLYIYECSIIALSLLMAQTQALFFFDKTKKWAQHNHYGPLKKNKDYIILYINKILKHINGYLKGLLYAYELNNFFIESKFGS
jgi:hypothetical protein